MSHHVHLESIEEVIAEMMAPLDSAVCPALLFNLTYNVFMLLVHARN